MGLRLANFCHNFQQGIDGNSVTVGVRGQGVGTFIALLDPCIGRRIAGEKKKGKANEKKLQQASCKAAHPPSGGVNAR